MKSLETILNKNLKEKSTPGSVLRAFRKSLNLTQNDLVEITGIQRPNISALENGGQMTAQNAEKFAAALGIHPSTLLYPNGEFVKKGELVKIEKKAQSILKKKQA